MSATKADLMEIAENILSDEAREDFEYLTVVEHEDAQDLSDDEQRFIYEIITTAKVTFAEVAA